MPDTTCIIEDFVIADVQGHEVYIQDVALAIEYSPSGLYKIYGAGFVKEYGPFRNDIAWFQDGHPLETIILERAKAKYTAQIDEHVWDRCRDDERVY